MDEHVAEYLFKRHGIAALREWDATPMFLLPQDGFTEYLQANESQIWRAHASIDQLPFDDFIVAMDAPHFDNQPRTLIVRVHRGEDAVGRIDNLPWFAEQLAPDDEGISWRLSAFIKSRPQDWILGIDFSPVSGDPDGPGPDTYAINKMAPWNDDDDVAYQRDTWQQYLESNIRWVKRIPTEADYAEHLALIDSDIAWQKLCRKVAVLAVAYLVNPPLHFVDVTPPQPALTRSKRSRDQLPAWKFPRQHIVLIDPERLSSAIEGEKETESGTRRPHPRRGHWRRLDGGDRRTWVRPAWIGPDAWQLDGALYRLRVAG